MHTNSLEKTIQCPLGVSSRKMEGYTGEFSLFIVLQYYIFICFRLLSDILREERTKLFEFFFNYIRYKSQ